MGNQTTAPTIIHAQCEDCDRGFAVSMEGEQSCLGCGRAVCDTGCSASNGEGRVCLECVYGQR